jgi:uncharacterized protein YjbJ (UPF0337 family)
MKPRDSVVLAGAAMVLALSLSACDRGDGADQKTKGQFESAAGDFTGNDHLKHEGKKDEVVGGVKKTFGDIRDAAHDASK